MYGSAEKKNWWIKVLVAVYLKHLWIQVGPTCDDMLQTLVATSVCHLIL